MTSGRWVWAWRHPRKAVVRLLGLPTARPKRKRSADGGAEREDAAARPAATSPGRLQPGLTIIGYLRSEIGLGQAARNIAYAADRARLPLSFRNLPLPGRQNDLEFASKCNQIADRRASLLTIGLPAVGECAEEIRPGRFNILYPFWELGGIPEKWLVDARQFDEVWAPSSFIASAFAGLDRPVRLLRQPVRLPVAMPPPRTGRNEFRLFTYFDFDSFGARKNPQAAVRAFQAAFPPARGDVELTIKARGGDDNGLRGWLRDVAAADARIKVIDEVLSRAAMDELMASSDAFISLHRSEGFGFGAAEALAAGKAVVATDFGGTTDFINVETGYPIDYRLDPVGDLEYVAPEGQVWATANEESAAQALRSLYDHPDDAALRTARGFAVLKAHHSTAAVGAAMAELLADRGLLGAIDDATEATTMGEADITSFEGGKAR